MPASNKTPAMSAKVIFFMKASPLLLLILLNVRSAVGKLNPRPGLRSILFQVGVRPPAEPDPGVSEPCREGLLGHGCVDDDPRLRLRFGRSGGAARRQAQQRCQKKSRENSLSPLERRQHFFRRDRERGD